MPYRTPAASPSRRHAGSVRVTSHAAAVRRERGGRREVRCRSRIKKAPAGANRRGPPAATARLMRDSSSFPAEAAEFEKGRDRPAPVPLPTRPPALSRGAPHRRSVVASAHHGLAMLPYAYRQTRTTDSRHSWQLHRTHARQLPNGSQGGRFRWPRLRMKR